MGFLFLERNRVFGPDFAALLRGADDVRTYWQTTKEWFEMPVLVAS